MNILREIKYLYLDLIDYIGIVIGYVPIHKLRLEFYKYFLGLKIGKNSSIHRCCQIRRGNIIIGENCVIGENCLLDGRRGIIIGDNVNISSNVSIYTLQHDYNDPNFTAVGGPVKIGNHCWISSNSIILPNVILGEGVVVGAMSLVTKDQPAYKLIGGSPAKIIKDRNKTITYRLKYHKRFQ